MIEKKPPNINLRTSAFDAEIITSKLFSTLAISSLVANFLRLTLLFILILASIKPTKASASFSPIFSLSI